jgi:hypothetical protein
LNPSVMEDNEKIVFRSSDIELNHVGPQGSGFFKRFDRILLCVTRGTTVSND